MAKKKHCSKCGRDEDDVDFEKHRRVCQECRQKQKKDRVYELRELHYSYLEKSFCIHCGENNPLVLHSHHREDNKFLGVSEMINKGYSWNKIKKELDKCDTLCANCHSIMTVVEADNTKLQRFFEYVPHSLVEPTL